MNIRHAGNVSDAMKDLAHADTLRPPAPSPWLDAPTHDGLWWVKGEGEGADITIFMLRHHYGKLWRITGISGEGLEELHPAWRFAPAVPPALP